MECEIREWKMDDAEELAAIVSNKKVLDNLRDGLPYPYKKSDAVEFISAMLGEDKNDVIAFAIVFDGALVGSIGVFRQQNIHARTAEMGYYIGEEYWGRGIASNAIAKVTRYVFDNTDIIRIFAEPFSRNAASCRALEKAGFKFEGTLRSNAVKNGEILDMRMYSLVKEDLI